MPPICLIMGALDLGLAVQLEPTRAASGMSVDVGDLVLEAESGMVMAAESVMKLVKEFAEHHCTEQ